MHCCEEEAGIGCLAAADILRSVVPIHCDRVDESAGLAAGVSELHDTANVVRFAGRFGDEVYVI